MLFILMWEAESLQGVQFNLTQTRFLFEGLNHKPRHLQLNRFFIAEIFKAIMIVGRCGSETQPTAIYRK